MDDIHNAMYTCFAKNRTIFIDQGLKIYGYKVIENLLLLLMENTFLIKNKDCVNTNNGIQQFQFAKHKIINKNKI